MCLCVYVWPCAQRGWHGEAGPVRTLRAQTPKLWPKEFQWSPRTLATKKGLATFPTSDLSIHNMFFGSRHRPWFLLKTFLIFTWPAEALSTQSRLGSKMKFSSPWINTSSSPEKLLHHKGIRRRSSLETLVAKNKSQQSVNYFCLISTFWQMSLFVPLLPPSTLFLSTFFLPATSPGAPSTLWFLRYSTWGKWGIRVMTRSKNHGECEDGAESVLAQPAPIWSGPLSTLETRITERKHIRKVGRRLRDKRQMIYYSFQQKYQQRSADPQVLFWQGYRRG